MAQEMSENKLTVEEHQGLEFRRATIRSKQNELHLLIRELKYFEKEIMDKYGLKAGVDHVVSDKGHISEVKGDSDATK